MWEGNSELRDQHEQSPEERKGMHVSETEKPSWLEHK